MKRLRNRTSITAVLLSVLLAFSFWLIHNLSQNYTEVVSVPVAVVSNIPGRSDRCTEPVNIVARCRASGFYLLWNRFSGRSKAVEINVGGGDLIFEDGDSYSLPADVLERFYPRIFGTDVQIVELISRNLEFEFQPQGFKKVPVVTRHNISYRSQYMPEGEIALSKDSVIVYGEPSRLESITAVYTAPLVLKDVGKNMHGAVKLDCPRDVRLSDSELAYTIEVVRYVEMHKRVELSVINLPAGTEVIVNPRFVDVTFRCRFPYSEGTVELTEFYVDYRDFASSRTGKCMVRYDSLPESVIDCSIEPQICECVEKSSL